MKLNIMLVNLVPFFVNNSSYTCRFHSDLVWISSRLFTKVKEFACPKCSNIFHEWDSSQICILYCLFVPTMAQSNKRNGNDCGEESKRRKVDGHSFAVPHFGDSLYYLAFLALDKIPDEFWEFCDQFKKSLSVF